MDSGQLDMILVASVNVLALQLSQLQFTQLLVLPPSSFPKYCFKLIQMIFHLSDYFALDKKPANIICQI